MHTSFIVIIVITIHDCNNVCRKKSVGYVPDFVADAVDEDQSAVFLLLCCNVIHTLYNKTGHWDIINLI